MKLMPEAVKLEIENMNKARRIMGLSLIDIRILTCTKCGEDFESAGRKTCCVD